jgi:hypothetical protein
MLGFRFHAQQKSVFDRLVMTRSIAPLAHALNRSRSSLFVVLFLVLGVGQADAGSWTGTLQDGTVLKVDPSTQRAMRYYNGGVAPLWNGTHRLEDGSVVIVRDGQVVPTESMMSTWAGEPGAEPTLSERYCDQLVRKTCGFHEECARSKPCVLARQLLRIEREQQSRAPIGEGSPTQAPSSSECRDALSSPSFPACSVSAPAAKDTPCKKLVDRVCGAAGECEAGKACDPARQLLQMETDERLQSTDPDAVTPTGAECETAMTNSFFEPCQKAKAPVVPNPKGPKE